MSSLLKHEPFSSYSGLGAVPAAGEAAGVEQLGGGIPAASPGSNASAVPDEQQLSDGTSAPTGGESPSAGSMLSGQPAVEHTPSPVGMQNFGQNDCESSAHNDIEDSETPPKHYRSLNEIYDDTSEIELELDSEGEALLVEVEEPTRYANAAGNPDWEKAMENEIQSIEKNGTWALTELPAGHRPIGLKWVFKLKKNAEGEVLKHKARLVAKGYVQKQGVDYEEVFAPVARLDTVKLLLALAANRGWEVHHLDVKTAFLNGELEEEVYVSQPEGYAVRGKERKVYKLSKALYGLKQAPRAWNIKLDRSLKELGFIKCFSEQAVYKRGIGKTAIILGVYVDDLIVTGSEKQEIEMFKKQMTDKFEMSDLGLLSYYLGIEVDQQKDFSTLKQSGYAKKVLERFGMHDCNPSKVPMDLGTKLYDDKSGQRVDATKYRRIIGCLRYLVHTRPDLAYLVGVASRYMEKPTTLHMLVVKKIVRYLRGTVDLGLVYTLGEKQEEIVGYSDSDNGGDLGGRRSTAGMAFYLNESLITWGSQKQKTVALSSCEAEFMAATAAAQQALWLRNLYSKLTATKPFVVPLYVDNISAIELMKHPVFHGRSKHIDIKYRGLFFPSAPKTVRQEPIE